MSKKLFIFSTVIAITMILTSTKPIFSKKTKPLTPTRIPGVTTVNDKWVKANYKKIMVFDVRKKAEYVEAHIPGAISNHYKEKSRKAVNFNFRKDRLNMSKFPVNKNTPIIIHCNGPRCWKSYKASVILKRAGYKKIYWYRNNGFPGWKSKGYPVE